MSSVPVSVPSPKTRKTSPAPLRPSGLARSEAIATWVLVAVAVDVGAARDRHAVLAAVLDRAEHAQQRIVAERRQVDGARGLVCTGAECGERQRDRQQRELRTQCIPRTAVGAT